MKTTVTLEPDAFQAAKTKAAQENISLGKAISELILQAISGQSQPARGSLSKVVFRSQGGIYTSEQVEAVVND